MQLLVILFIIKIIAWIELFCQPPYGKFNIVRKRNGYWCTQSCNFSFLYRKYSFWANLFQKIKIVSLSWNLISTLIRICRIHCWWSLSPLSICKFCPNNLFGILMLPDQSPSSLLTETSSQWLFLLHFKILLLNELY